jgi:Ca-activated chloride channel homolog
MLRKTAFLLGALWLSWSAVSRAQDVLRVDVELVNLVATVTDAEGRYVTGLEASDFVVEDERELQQVTHFSEDTDIPVTIGITLDTSGSMAERMRTALVALDRFVESLHPDDEIIVTTFSSGVKVVEKMGSGREGLPESLSRVEVAGGTALYDAVADIIDRVQAGRHDKRAVVVLTDGADTLSDLRLNEVLQKVRSHEVLVYALGIDTLEFADADEHVRFDWPLSSIPGLSGVRTPRWRDAPVDQTVLESFARASGGQAYLVSGTWTDGIQEEVDQVLDEVAAELRSQYTIGYYPTSPRDGRFHPIRVRVAGREDYTVRTRNGYLSPDPRESYQ